MTYYITAKKDLLLLIIIATVDMVLLDDTRVVSCDSQLLAIQCTWSTTEMLQGWEFIQTSDKRYTQQKGIVPLQ